MVPPTATATTTAPTPTPTTTPDGVIYRIYLPLILKSCTTNLLISGDFEAGSLEPWGSWDDVGLGSGYNSPYGAWLGGVNDAGGELLQVVPIPSEGSPVWLKFWWLAETTGNPPSEQPDDVVEVFVQYGDEQADHLLTLRAVAPLGQWQEEMVDLTAYAGQEVAVTFLVHTDAEVPSTFRLDNINLEACGVAVPWRLSR